MMKRYRKIDTILSILVLCVCEVAFAVYYFVPGFAENFPYWRPLALGFFLFAVLFLLIAVFVRIISKEEIPRGTWKDTLLNLIILESCFLSRDFVLFRWVVLLLIPCFIIRDILKLNKL